MNLGPETIGKSIELVHDLLVEYQERLDEAYRKAEDSLSVTLTLKITPDEGRNKIDASISFVVEKAKDTATSYADENQQELFEGENLDDKLSQIK
ncbi:MAG TPA: hypothetical protein ENI07_15620 [Desulfobacterales bacterium]|nr:hypothetical protein [Desulfobacterales bacterium]